MRRTIFLILSLAFSVNFGFAQNTQISFLDKKDKFGTLIINIPVLKFEDGTPLSEDDKPRFQAFVKSGKYKKEVPHIKEGIYQTEVKEGFIE